MKDIERIERNYKNNEYQMESPVYHRDSSKSTHNCKYF